MNIVIKEFLDEKRQARIESKSNNKMSAEEILKIESDAAEEFSLDIWLPNAAKRANQLSIVTHNGKLTHTGVKKESSVVVECSRNNDGYVRSGNVEVDMDVIGNAAALDVFKFLNLKLPDGISILQHLESDSSVIKKEFDIPTASYKELTDGFLSIKKSNDDAISSDRLKQVYFPVDDNYHLLSLLTPSGIVYKLKEKIIMMKFSDSAKKAKEDRKHNLHNENGFTDLYDLTVIGFGGTKPQNAGDLSNINGGKAYLLNSLPPSFSNRSIHPPKKGFFDDFIRLNFFQDEFDTLYHILEVDKRNNIDIRYRRDNLFSTIISKVVFLLMQIRELEPGWSTSDYYNKLNPQEAIWLDNLYSDKRLEDDKYLSFVKNELLRWITVSYSRHDNKNIIYIPEDDLRHLKDIIIEHEEGLR